MYRSGIIGQCSVEAQVIKIGTFINKDQQVVTMLHEIIHCICGLYNVTLPEEDTEPIVDGIARGLFQVFKDNPQLNSYLNGTLEK